MHRARRPNERRRAVSLGFGASKKSRPGKRKTVALDFEDKRPHVRCEREQLKIPFAEARPWIEGRLKDSRRAVSRSWDVEGERFGTRGPLASCRPLAAVAQMHRPNGYQAAKDFLEGATHRRHVEPVSQRARNRCEEIAQSLAPIASSRKTRDGLVIRLPSDRSHWMAPV